MSANVTADAANKPIVIEELYPEFGNQAGDNGNLMYLRACLPQAVVVRTPFSAEPAFMSHEVSCVLLGGMTESQQVKVAARMMPYRDRLLELADAGVPMLFTGNAAELLGKKIVDPEGNETSCLGIFDFVTRQEMPNRYDAVFVGDFSPVGGVRGKASIEMTGFKAQFTQMQGVNDDCCFCRVTANGFGLDLQGKTEGFMRNRLIATWLIGPILPSNPDFARWFLDAMGAADAPLAFEDVAREAYELRLAELKTPGITLE